MTRLPFHQVDAFAEAAFEGNPAAVMPLGEWLPDAVMQAIAAENNLAETAFLVPSARDDADYDLRWFTPTVEVDLCGHATLASGFVLMELLEPGRTHVRYHTRSGPLEVTRRGEAYTLDFPSRPPRPVEAVEAVARALGHAPRRVLQARDTLAVFESAEEVRALKPDMAAVAALPDTFAVLVTAPGTGRDGDVDFVSRFFAPAKGVPEDPVTGSAHCTLTPYWAERLGKTRLRARQVSRRGGELACELAGERVRLTGQAVLTRSGTFHLGGVEEDSR